MPDPRVCTRCGMVTRHPSHVFGEKHKGCRFKSAGYWSIHIGMFRARLKALGQWIPEEVKA